MLEALVVLLEPQPVHDSPPLALDPTPGLDTKASPPRESSAFSFDFNIQLAPKEPVRGTLRLSPTVANAPETPRAATVGNVHPRRRRANDSASLAPSRHNEHIAAKTKGTFINIHNQAVHRKALVNALSGC